MNRRSRSAFLVPIVLVAAMLLGAQPAGAFIDGDTIVTPRVGVWEYRDGSGSPGATCRYYGDVSGTSLDYKLNHISIRYPIAFASRAGGQYIRWRFRIDRQYTPVPDAYATETIFTSSWQRRFATKTRRADFERRKWYAPNPPEASDDTYIVWIIIQWMQQADPSSKEGSVKGHVEWYRNRLLGASSGPDSHQYYCYTSY